MPACSKLPAVKLLPKELESLKAEE